MTPDQVLQIQALGAANAKKAIEKHGRMPHELAQRIGADLIAAHRARQQQQGRRPA